MVFKDFIGLRVLTSTRDRVIAAADQRGLTVSDFVRQAVVREARIALCGERSSREEVNDE